MKNLKTSEERILQILNDISENMGSRTKSELEDVVKYQANLITECYAKIGSLKLSLIDVATTAVEMASTK